MLRIVQRQALLPVAFVGGINWTRNASFKESNIEIRNKFSKLRDHYGVPQYPIVLCHGLSGFDSLVLLRPPRPSNDSEDVEEVANSVLRKGITVNYWHGIEAALTKAGATVITARVPPFGSIEQRARHLDQLLLEKCRNLVPEGHRLKVNVVGHSMGGLDARYLISQVQTDKSPYQVASLTTIGTPHHGSECADFVMELIGRDDTLRDLCPAAIPELTTESMATFNKSIQNDPKVAYFSYGALMTPKMFRVFRPTYEIIKYEMLKRGESNYDNDGMVSVELSKWGEYLGTLVGVDHLDLINWTNRMRTTVYQVVFGREPNFDPVALYLDIAESLSKRGF